MRWWMPNCRFIMKQDKWLLSSLPRTSLCRTMCRLKITTPGTIYWWLLLKLVAFCFHCTKSPVNCHSCDRLLIGIKYYAQAFFYGKGRQKANKIEGNAEIKKESKFWWTAFHKLKTSLTTHIISFISFAVAAATVVRKTGL